MPNISSKGNNMPESPIRKLVPFAEIAKNKGKSDAKIQHLAIFLSKNILIQQHISQK